MTYFWPTCQFRGPTPTHKKNPGVIKISKLHTSIPNDKIFDISKLKAFADDKN